MVKSKKQAKRKQLSGKIKWAMLMMLILAAGAVVEWIRIAEVESAVQVTAPFQPQYSANTNPNSSIELAASITGIAAFRERYGTSGAEQKIALIDSGIDLSHPAFGANENGTRKVAVYYDYTDEGLLYTDTVQQEGAYISTGGMRYYIGGIYNSADTFCVAFLKLSALCPQIPDAAAGEIAVLVTATGDRYDCVYIDTDQNGDFTDETPLYCYQVGGSHVMLQCNQYTIAVAVSAIAADGRSVQISTDTLGHGTFLAGVIAANGDAYSGLAPNAQLYVYKIFDREAASSQQKLAQAINQAVQDDVDCINLSLSIPKTEVILTALSDALQSAQDANIPIIAAAGNYGPGKDTVAYPACVSSVIGVGSAAYPEQYLLDRAVLLEQWVIPDYSGRGSLNGKTAPLLVAPSGVISTVPNWYHEQYLYDYGTSISAAMVTAAVSHLQESVKAGVLPGTALLSTEEIKQILAHWAQDLSYPAYEQGYGALYMGILHPSATTTALPKTEPIQPVVYSFRSHGMDTEEKQSDLRADVLWRFSVPQGVSQSWYVNVPKQAKTLEFQLIMDTEQPTSPFEHLIAMGRCRMYLYNPDGVLADATVYIGASYGKELNISEKVSIQRPKEGIWEIVITSADNLSLYHHFTSTGMVYGEMIK